jgi:hypothetical protein
MINAATANRHVIYEASSTSVSVQPAVSLGATRLNVMVRW